MYINHKIWNIILIHTSDSLRYNMAVLNNHPRKLWYKMALSLASVVCRSETYAAILNHVSDWHGVPF